jgi:nitric oxide reductase NorD protein
MPPTLASQAAGASAREDGASSAPAIPAQSAGFDAARPAPYQQALGRMLDEAAQVALLEVLGELEQVAPDCVAPVLGRIEFLLARAGVPGLYGWALAGLRAYAGERAARLRYFTCSDALSVQILNWEAAGRPKQLAPAALEAYLFGLSGLTVDIGTRRQGLLNGPPARPVLTRMMLALPDSYTFLDCPDRNRLMRAASAHAAAHLLFSPAAQPAATRKPLALTVISLLEDARAEALLARRYLGVEMLWRSLHAASPDDGLGCGALLARLSRALIDPHYRDDNFWVNKGRRLFDAQRACLEDAAAFHSIAGVLANDLGQMRVQFDLPGYAAAPAYRDDHSYLWDYGEQAASDHAALEQPVTLQFLPDGVSADAASGSSAVSPLDASPAEELTWGAQRSVNYPEWDERIETLRDNWCTLYEKFGREPGATTTQMRRARLRSLAGGGELDRSVRLKRQPQGERFDLDALVDAISSRRQGGNIDERVFENPGRRVREASVLLLLDVSASSASRLGSHSVSVLETEKALALHAVALARQGGHRTAVHGFASNTRKHVHYERYLDFDMPFCDASRQRLAGATAAGSTRFGAAVRHATALIEDQPNDLRAILMVTDGAPADIDVTRDAYLVEDARVAVQHARRAGIRCFCMALDAQADSYVRRIFGAGNYLIAVDPDFLQQRLKSVLAKLVRP